MARIQEDAKSLSLYSDIGRQATYLKRGIDV